MARVWPAGGAGGARAILRRRTSHAARDAPASPAAGCATSASALGAHAPPLSGAPPPTLARGPALHTHRYTYVVLALTPTVAPREALRPLPTVVRCFDRAESPDPIAMVFFVEFDEKNRTMLRNKSNVIRVRRSCLEIGTATASSLLNECSPRASLQFITTTIKFDVSSCQTYS